MRYQDLTTSVFRFQHRHRGMANVSYFTKTRQVIYSRFQLFKVSMGFSGNKVCNIFGCFGNTDTIKVNNWQTCWLQLLMKNVLSLLFACLTSTPTVVKSIRANLVQITLMIDGSFKQYEALVIQGENHLGPTMKDFIAGKLAKAIRIRKTAYLREGNL